MAQSSKRSRARPGGGAAGWPSSADAVEHAFHSRGILHRDIKPPDNVILTGVSERLAVRGSARSKAGTVSHPEGLTPRLADFGLAKLVEEAGDDTRSDGRVGTPHYMAPEQAAGRPCEISPATDVYALAARPRFTKS